MNIIVVAMLLWFTSLLIFKFTLIMQALDISVHGALNNPGLPVIENCYPGYKKEIPQLHNYKKILHGYLIYRNENKHSRYYIKKHVPD